MGWWWRGVAVACSFWHTKIRGWGGGGNVEEEEVVAAAGCAPTWPSCVCAPWRGSITGEQPLVLCVWLAHGRTARQPAKYYFIHQSNSCWVRRAASVGEGVPRLGLFSACPAPFRLFFCRTILAGISPRCPFIEIDQTHASCRWPKIAVRVLPL